MQRNLKFYKTEQATERKEKLITDQEERNKLTEKVRLGETAFILFDFR